MKLPKKYKPAEAEKLYREVLDWRLKYSGVDHPETLKSMARVAYSMQLQERFAEAAFILSGFIFQISSMPATIQLITHIVPARYFVAILQSLFLAGNVWSVILPNAAALLLMATGRTAGNL